MKKKKRKCIAWSKESLYCDGCKQNGGRCPYRDKYRDLRNTKYGNELYMLYKKEIKEIVRGE